MRISPNAREMELWEQKTPRRVRRTANGWATLIVAPVITIPLWVWIPLMHIVLIGGIALNWFGVPTSGQILGKTIGHDKRGKNFSLRIRYSFNGAAYSFADRVNEIDYGVAKVGEAVPLSVLSVLPSETARLEKYTQERKQDQLWMKFAWLPVDIGVFFFLRYGWLDGRKQRELVSFGELDQANVSSIEKSKHGSYQIASCVFTINGKTCEKQFHFPARELVDRKFYVVALPQQTAGAMLWEHLLFRPAKPSKRRTTRAVVNSSESP